MPRATGTPASTISRPGLRRRGDDANAVTGSSTAVTPAAARRRRSSAVARRRCSAEVARNRAASRAPPESTNSSAWTLTPRPRAAAARSSRSDCRTEKNPGSQKTSQIPREPLARDGGKRLANEQVDVGVRAPAILLGHGVRAEERRDEGDPELVGEPRDQVGGGAARPATSRAYPDFTSTEVAPFATMRRRRPAVSSGRVAASGAARVARTVE